MARIEEAVTRNINKLSDTEKFVVMEIAPQLRFAGNWGFLVKGEDYFETKQELLKTNTEKITIQEVKNGYLFTADDIYLVNTVNELLPGVLNFEYKARAMERKQTDKEMFVKFMQGIIRGKESKFVKVDKRGRRFIIIGLYCTNNVNLIRLNGNEYKAYKLTFLEAMQGLKSLDSELLSKVNILVKDNDAYYARQLGTVLSTVEGRQSAFSAMQIAETKTGVLMTLYI